MVIKIFVSHATSTLQIKNAQKKVCDFVTSHGIPLEIIDIADPGKQEDLKFMRANSVPKPGQKNPLPPQIFNDDEYCGDYTAFAEAVETEDVYAFLKMADQKHVSNATIEPPFAQQTLQMQEVQD